MTRRGGLTAILAVGLILTSAPALAAASELGGFALPWWIWPVLLFVVTFLLGIVAVLAGVGGAVLFVPIVGGLFPFHFDFVRGAGLLIALSVAIAAGPALLRTGMANLRLAMPLALIASIGAIGGAYLGLALPVEWVQLGLGVTILGVVGVMLRSRKSDFPDVPRADVLSDALRMNGVYIDFVRRRKIEWRVHRTPLGLALFAGIGVLAGMFGIGAGWANVAVLNLVMGAPLKVSVATSTFMLSIVDTAAVWVYINQGAVLAIIAVPSIIGVMLGSFVSVRLLAVVSTAQIRRVVIVMLLLAGLRAFLKGLGI
ncbi:MAG: sulfite exporter TauE/SafE family protein [Alphaproteobacteria bacterium]|nr:sulfite exporter TauE/SafE family protein [Alphaproteobacteria bacterium]